MYICHVTKTESRKSRKSYFNNCVIIKNCIILITAILIKKIGQSCNGDHNIGLVSLSVQKMDGAYKKISVSDEKSAIWLVRPKSPKLQSRPKNSNLRRNFKRVSKKYHFENKTSTSQDNKLNFGFYLIKKY